MTKETERAIHLAMEQAGGVRKIAAEILRVPMGTLNRNLTQNDNLRARWSKSADKSVPGDPDTIHRPATTFTEEELRTAVALKNEDDSIRLGLRGLGLSSKSIDLSRACQQYQKVHYRTAIEGISGGIYRQFMKVMEAIDEIDERLADRKDFPISLPEEAMLREDRRGLLKVMGEYKTHVDQAVLIQAKVFKALKDKKEKDKDRRPKGVVVLDLASAAS